MKRAKVIRKEIYIKNISAALALLSREVEILNCVNLFDVNHLAEDFYAQLLNMVYGYNLCNLNAGENNAPAVDLGDEANRLSIQVTSDNTSDKIKSTIAKFIEHKLYLKFDRLVVLLLTQNKNYSAKFDTQGYFSFDRQMDIIDYTDLMKAIGGKDKATLKSINEFLEDELVNKLNNKTVTSQASEVDTIIDLIEYITKNRDIKEKRNTVIDPGYKIENRFKEFAGRLKSDYLMLYTLYGEALQLVYTTLEIDEAQDLITVMYLQDISIKILDEALDNPVMALDKLVAYFEQKLSANDKKYDRAAIKFYLVNELIKCNVFPNERCDYNVDK